MCIFICVSSNKKKLDCKLSLLELHPKVVVISSDGENNHSFPINKCNYGVSVGNIVIMLFN